MMVILAQGWRCSGAGGVCEGEAIGIGSSLGGL